MQKAIITGANGLVGARLCHDLSKNFEVIAIGGPNSSFDIKIDLNKNLETLSQYNPDYFIHCAAIASPETCEKNKELSSIVNLEATKRICKILPKSCKLIFISTDLVFENYAEAPKDGFSEKDKVSFHSHYSHTKAESEKYVLEREHSIVLRISLSLDLLIKRGYLFNALNNLKANKELNCYHDEFRTPLILNELSEVINKLMKTEFSSQEIFHFCSGYKITRFDLGKLIAKTWGLNENLIIKKSIKEHRGLVKRAKDVSLDSSKLRKLLNLETLDFKEQLSKLKNLDKIISG